MQLNNLVFSKSFFVLVYIITCPLFGLCQLAEKIDGLGLSNMYRVDNGIYRSEQPKTAQFKAVEKYGIAEILNLRQWHSDKKFTKNTNLVLHRVRMNAHDINDYDVVMALKTIKNRKGAILIHCRHGSDRTGTIVAMYRIIFQNWSKEQAIEELKNECFGFHEVYINIPKYITNVDIDDIKLRIEN